MAIHFLKPVATFSFSTHGTLYRNMLSAMCIESSHLDVNSTTIYMGTAIREYEIYSWSRESGQYALVQYTTQAPQDQH